MAVKNDELRFAVFMKEGNAHAFFVLVRVRVIVIGV